MDDSINGNKGKLVRKVMRAMDESTHENLRYFGNHRCLSQSEESNFQVFVFVCTFIRISRHFSGEFSLSFHLLYLIKKLL